MLNLDLKKLEKMIELIEQTDVTEIEIKEGEVSVRIQRGLAALPEKTVPFPEKPSVSSALPSTPAPVEVAVVESHKYHTVHSPMVGTFYAAPSPQAKPFAQVGQSVKAGDVLCIIEAMKMMNQIESDKTGIIKKIHGENGMPVEFDQPLFDIE